MVGTGFSPQKLDDSLFASEPDVDTSLQFVTVAKEIIERMNTGDGLSHGMAVPGVVLPLQEEDKEVAYDFDIGDSVSQANISVSSSGSATRVRLLRAKLLHEEANRRAGESEHWAPVDRQRVTRQELNLELTMSEMDGTRSLDGSRSHASRSRTREYNDRDIPPRGASYSMSDIGHDRRPPPGAHRHAHGIPALPRSETPWSRGGPSLWSGERASRWAAHFGDNNRPRGSGYPLYAEPCPGDPRRRWWR